ncbi:MAG TPA: M23 family metallopeptidase [Vicinamibacterales bacterium]|nr:M23 family metallopeptidase [Vicinamibacterales bacterium]
MLLKLLFTAGLSALLFGQSRAPIVQSVDLSVPFAPVVFSQDGYSYVAYELHITNFQAVDVTLNSLRLTSQGAPLAEFSGDELRRRIVRPGFRNDYATPHLVGPGQRAIVTIWSPLPLFVGAASITQTIDLDVMRPAGAVRTSASLLVTAQPIKPLVIGPPLGAGQWVAMYDPLLKGGHRTAVYTIDGRARIPGRFAIDFITLPPSGAMIRNQSPRPPDLNGFGADVLAVADGTIAAALDDTADDMPQPVSPELASGNYVAIDIGDGHFAFYEHLQQGSVRVKAGDRVKRGQVIGRLGSSGSSSIGPHLHFHVADANSLLGAESVPFAFERFTVLGDFESLAALTSGERWRPSQVARPSATTRPAPNVVLSFQ